MEDITKIETLKENNEFECKCCGSVNSRDELCYDDEDDEICQGCFDSYYLVCDICGRVHSIDESYWIESEENTVCDVCYDGNYFLCPICDKHEHIDKGLDVVYERGEEGTVCERCAEDYSRCESCGHYHYSDSMRHVDSVDVYVCEECYYSYEDKQIIKSYHFHKDEPKMFYDINGATRFEKDGLMYFGIENEIVNNDSELEDVAKLLQNELGDIIYFEHDSSISEGFETITHPMTYQFLRTKYEDYQKAFNQAKEINTEVDDTCGMHIHVNRAYISKDYQEMRNFEDLIKALFEFFQDEIKQLSKRNKYAYCSFLTSDLKDEKLIKERVKGDKTRHTVVNTTNSKTIEIRVFKATLDESVFYANIEFTRNVIDILKDKNIETLTWNDIINYNEHSSNLNKLINNLNIVSDSKTFSKTI